ncbi:hypothetical protein LTR37_008984 [Vermiconidia calcicola]|uniref:Uncharacterized protein n=1 Tax=Vermiconidia calcicola TaxID=1690605 RepID=A0ACC3N969_9PEZI|nr:hypothetical protein LTR37_008984 [Vermiconidia calcicola]
MELDMLSIDPDSVAPDVSKALDTYKIEVESCRLRFSEYEEQEKRVREARTLVLSTLSNSINNVHTNAFHVPEVFDNNQPDAQSDIKATSADAKKTSSKHPPLQGRHQRRSGYNYVKPIPIRGAGQAKAGLGTEAHPLLRRPHQSRFDGRSYVKALQRTSPTSAAKTTSEQGKSKPGSAQEPILLCEDDIEAVQAMNDTGASQATKAELGAEDYPS